MNKGVFLPLDFFQRIDVVALHLWPTGQTHSTVKLAAVRVWICWGRAGGVVQEWSESSRFVNFLWADLESLGVFSDAKGMMDALVVCGMVIVLPDGTAVLNGYDELNRHLDPLYVDPQRKGGFLRHWRKQQAQAAEDARKRVELEKAADMPLDFGDESPDEDTRKRAVGVVFALQVALDRSVAEPGKDELSAALALVKSMPEPTIEAGLRVLTENRARPDVAETDIVTALRSFAAMTAALGRQS